MKQVEKHPGRPSTLTLMFFLTLAHVTTLSSPDDVYPACKIPECICSPSSAPSEKNVSKKYDVKCFVNSVSSSDMTLRSIPHDVTSLTLECSGPNRESFLTKGLFLKFDSLEHLRVSKCNFTIFSPHFTTGKVQLASFTANECSFPDLEETTLSTFSKLQHLTIVQSRTRNLPSISHMKSLRLLNLSHNSFGDARMRDLIHSTDGNLVFTNLSVVDLSHNALTMFPLRLVRCSLNMEVLNVANNGIKEIHIPKDVLWNRLRQLNVADNAIESIDFPSLSSTRVQELLLDGSGHPLYLRDIFSLQDLIELRLTNFAVNDSIWSQLTFKNLTRLDLTKNNLETVSIDTLPRIRILRLGYNKLSMIDNSTFDQQSSLQLINLTHNAIATLPPSIFEKNTGLKVLDISNNMYSVVESRTYRGLTEMIYLDLSNNAIEKLSYVIFRDMKNMQFLYLQGNRIKYLPSLSVMSSLRILNISHNQILRINFSTFAKLHNLELLFASNNKLSSLSPGIFSSCPNLVQAHLHNNRISTVGSLEAHPSLILLRLENNSISNTFTESPFIKMKVLEGLFLDDNKLQALKPNMFPSSLKYISIAQNDLYVILRGTFENLPNLLSVNIMNSNFILLMLSSVVNIFKNHDPKPQFRLGFNAIRCTCDMAYLKAWSEDRYTSFVFQKFYPDFIDLKYLYCTSHLLSEGTMSHFDDVPLSHFVCPYKQRFCDVMCLCCNTPESCECALTCPVECDCYSGGSGFKKLYFHIICDRRGLNQIPLNIPPRTTNLHLDGNVLHHIRASDLAHLHDVEDIYLNGSSIESIEDGAFGNMTNIEILRLNGNRLRVIDAATFGYNMTRLQTLLLHDNAIEGVSQHAFEELPSLKILTLHGNRLISLTHFQHLSQLRALTLSDNPWSCDCNIIQTTITFLHALNDVIVDREKIWCCLEDNSSDLASNFSFVSSTEISVAKKWQTVENNSYETAFYSNNFDHFSSYPHSNNSNHFSSYPYSNNSNHSSSYPCQLLINFNYDTSCAVVWSTPTSSSVHHPAQMTTVLVILVVMTIVLSVVAAIIVVVLWKRRELQAWTFVKLGLRLFDAKTRQIDKEDAGDKEFDAFISYSSRDDEFVASTLVPALENDERRYRVCVHYRDFPIGLDITDTICNAIENSSRTILLLSQNFLESEWCHFEFQTAHRHILREGSHRLILVVLGDLPDQLMYPDLKIHLKSKTYLKYGEPWFWEKLYFALPNPKVREGDGIAEEDVLRGMKVLTGENKFPGNNQNLKNMFPNAAHKRINMAYEQTEDADRRQANLEKDFTNLFKDFRIDFERNQDEIPNDVDVDFGLDERDHPDGEWAWGGDGQEEGAVGYDLNWLRDEKWD